MDGLAFLLFLFTGARPAGATADLTKAVVVTAPALNRPQSKAVTMLVEEVEKRTGVRWPVSTE